MDRRGFIKFLAGVGALGILGWPDKALSQDGRSDLEPFHWARLKFKMVQKVSDIWAAHPIGDEAFLNTLHKETNLNVDRTWHVASLDHLKDMVQYPFIFMTAEGRMEFNRTQQNNFSEYLRRGGFIFADDCVAGRHGDFFFRDIKAKVEHLFGKKMVKLPNDHEIYRCYYNLNGLPHLQGVKHGGWGLFLDGRMAMYLSPSDLHCGWTSYYLRKNGKNTWFPKIKERQALEMGINVLIYALSH